MQYIFAKLTCKKQEHLSI